MCVMDFKFYVGVNVSGGVGDCVFLDGLIFLEDGCLILGYSMISYVFVCWNVVDGSAVEFFSFWCVVSMVVGEYFFV